MKLENSKHDKLFYGWLNKISPSVPWIFGLRVLEFFFGKTSNVKVVAPPSTIESQKRHSRVRRPIKIKIKSFLWKAVPSRWG